MLLFIAVSCEPAKFKHIHSASSKCVSKQQHNMAKSVNFVTVLYHYGPIHSDQVALLIVSIMMLKSYLAQQIISAEMWGRMMILFSQNYFAGNSCDWALHVCKYIVAL